MLAFLFRRLGQGLFVVAVMATLVFVGVYALGNPIDILISPEADQLEREQAITRLGLDRPIWLQFALFVKSALTGDFGLSFVHGVPAMELIVTRMPATLELAFVALVFSVFVGIPAGLMAGLRPRSLAGRGIMVTSILGFSVPNFWLGLMLILLFAVELGLLPAGGRGETRTVFGIEWSLLTLDGLRHLILPALTLGDLQGLADRPPRLCGHAGNAHRGFRALRPRQGPRAKPHRRRPRAQERADSRRHGHRPRARLDDRIRGRHRDGVRLARNGQAPDRTRSTGSTGR